MRLTKLGKTARVVLAIGAAGAASGIGLLAVPATFGAFTASSSNPNSVSAGTVKMTNSVNGALDLTGSGVYSATNLAPGHSVSDSVTITNSGSLPADVTLSVASVNVTGCTPSCSPSDYTMTIVDNQSTPATVFTGNLASTANPIALTSSAGNSTWAAADSATYTVTVTLASSAGNEAQGSSVSFDLNWASSSV